MALMDDMYLIQHVIQKSASSIGDQVDFCVIKVDLKEKGVFSTAELKMVEGTGKSNHAIMWTLCQRAEKLDLDNFRKFVDALSISYSHVAEQVEETYYELSGGKHLRKYETSEQHSNMDVNSQQGLCNQNFVDHHHVPSSLRKTRTAYEEEISKNETNVYKMDTIPRGLALIVNNMKFDNMNNRDWSKMDEARMTKTLGQLGFEVDVKPNKTAQEMGELFRDFASNPRLAEVSAMCIVILSHGCLHDRIFGTDGKISANSEPVAGTFLEKAKLKSFFSTSNCPGMENKPKLFVIQACRGVGISQARQPDGPTSMEVSPIQNSTADRGQITSMQSDCDIIKDMTFVFSSSAGSLAYSLDENGSPFIKKFAEILCNDASTDECRNIIQKVQQHFSETRVERLRMMPEISDMTLLKKWYLNPCPISGEQTSELSE